ncbi:nuclear transport factor 2 family protein [Mycobacterium paraintracellulare]|uniref:nuclear transport factor 2 family protein n=1 Tax=Mycobacterium paraintracellulare TaxID=1138383 RepID=UPI0019291C14|nr:nuclear transport factor 2 family protein [Mycobacterium paraintracellulare]BCP05409.1 hypothetical protein MINTM019_28650 [Mycobacterium paraintracellulare]
MDNDELSTRVGVAHLMATYQFLADSGKTRQLAQLFTPDAEFEAGGATYVGPEGVLDFFQRTKQAFVAAGFLPARHHLSSIYINPRPDGSVETYACFQFIGSRGLDHWGCYRDVVMPADGGWLFARRRVDVEGFAAGSPVGYLLGIAP